jgi:23S rRNA pseudouridine2605 synthase
MPDERLQRSLARAGFGSRRACEELIVAGRVEVNGQRATLGDRLDPAVDEVGSTARRSTSTPSSERSRSTSRAA